ncbi:MAG TPA: hypothetical protein VFQ54_11465 [Thermomicrobiales bacterium]|nr:hypothetical protein [Thermomicrobiales bacterium]
MIAFFWLEEYAHREDGWGLWPRAHEQTTVSAARSWLDTQWLGTHAGSSFLTLQLPDGTRMTKTAVDLDKVLASWDESCALTVVGPIGDDA